MVNRFFVGVIIVCAAFGQDKQDPKLASVRGQVVSATNAEPLRKANVTLVPASPRPATFSDMYSATTDGSGDFEIANVAPGRYRFGARKNGFLPGAYRPDEKSTAGTLLILSEGQSLKDVLFRLTPASAIIGRITDESGEPVPGVEIQALLKVDKAALGDEERMLLSGQLLPIGRSVTNDLGEYRVYGLPPGEYYVSAIDSGIPGLTEYSLRSGGFGFSREALNQETHPPVYFPGVARPEEAQLVSIKAGQDAHADVVLRPSKAGMISGRVLAQDGKPAASVSVSLRPKALPNRFSSLTYRATTDEKGHFEISNVPDGAYTVQAWLMGEDEASRLSAQQQAQLAENGKATVELRLSKGIEVSGRVVGDASLVFEQQFERRIRVWIRSTSDDVEGWSVGEVKKDGTFKTYGELPPGEYSVNVTNLPEGWYVKAIAAGNQDVLEAGLNITSASPDLGISLVRGAAHLEGSVTDGGSLVGGARVRLQPQKASQFRKDLQSETRTDQHGSFAFKNVAPDAYRVIADMADEQQVLTGSADAVDKRGETSVTVGTAETKRIQVALKAATNR